MTKVIIPGVGPEFMAREGLEEQPQPWEDGLRADTGRGSFEWWYFDAQGDDGTTVVATFATKPLLQRNDPLTPMLALTITPPDGRKRSGLKLFRPEDFSAAKDRCAVRIGPNRVEFSGAVEGSGANPAPWRFTLSAEVDGLAASLFFTGTAPPWRPGAGMNYYSADYSRRFAWLPSIPFGTVEGEVTCDGRTRRVAGTGYHDHNWGNVGLNDVMSHWYWGRAHVGEYTVIFVEMVSNASYGGVRLPVFMLAKGSRILTGDGRPLTLMTEDELNHPGGRTYPRRLHWHWQTAEGTVRLALRNPRIIEATSLLDLLPGWKRGLARLVANPYYFRFDADLEMDVALGTRETVRGPALYELMLLR